MLANVDMTCLQCPPAHLRVESDREVAEARMFGKSTIFVHEEILEVVPNSDLKGSWSHKISSTSRELKWGRRMICSPLC